MTFNCFDVSILSANCIIEIMRGSVRRIYGLPESTKTGRDLAKFMLCTQPPLMNLAELLVQPLDVLFPLNRQSLGFMDERSQIIH